MKEQYYGEVIARSVMFSNNIEEFLKKLGKALPKMGINLAEVIEIANETFIAYANSGFLSDKGKANIYMYLHYISRMSLPEDAKKIYNLYYQELIDMLNNGITNGKTIDFYRIELATRKNNKNYYNSKLVSDKRIVSQIPTVNESIENDFNVLFYHLDAPEYEYWNSQIGFVASSNFIESSRYLVYEWPGLISEPNFKNRLCSTFQMKEQMNRKYRKNIFKRFTLDKDTAHLGQIRFSRSDKKLYKQVSGM